MGGAKFDSMAVSLNEMADSLEEREEDAKRNLARFTRLNQDIRRPERDERR